MAMKPRIIRRKQAKQRRSALGRNHPLIALTALCGFVWLSYASEPYGHGYTEKERRDMDRLVESVTKPTSKREAIMDLWNLTEADIARPVTLWRD